MQYLSKNPYGNFEIQNNDGSLLFRCNKKKFDWYVTRNLVFKLCEKKARLLFQPAGIGVKDDPYLSKELPNYCVVCGTVSKLNLHHVVPYCYRIWMGRRLGRMNNFDVLPICVTCHTAYELEADKLKNHFIEIFKIDHNGFIINRELRKAKKVASALILHKDKMPAERIKEYKEFIKDYLGKHWFTRAELYRLTEANPATPVGKTAAEQIVDRVTDLNWFARFWRTHFINHARPKHLPKNWNPYERDAQGKLKG